MQRCLIWLNKLIRLSVYEYKGWILLPNWMNFWKSAKGGEGGGGVIFNPKTCIADFGNFQQGFLSMKLIKRRVISGFRVCFYNNCIEKICMHFILSGPHTSLPICNHIHYKKKLLGIFPKIHPIW